MRAHHLFSIVYEMAKREFMGGFELLVLLALIKLGDEAYGVPISEAIEESSGRDVAIGSVYLTLARLERNGLVSSRLARPRRNEAAGPKRTSASAPKGCVKCAGRSER